MVKKILFLALAFWVAIPGWCQHGAGGGGFSGGTGRGGGGGNLPLEKAIPLFTILGLLIWRAGTGAVRLYA